MDLNQTLDIQNQLMQDFLDFVSSPRPLPPVDPDELVIRAGDDRGRGSSGLGVVLEKRDGGRPSSTTRGGRAQSRIGPESGRGPQGILQWLVDGIQDGHERGIHPGRAIQSCFQSGTVCGQMGFVTTFVVLPFAR